MNKTELIEAIAKESGLKKKDAEAALVAFVDVVEKALADGKNMEELSLEELDKYWDKAKTVKNG